MQDPGQVIAKSADNIKMVEYANYLARRFDIAPSAAHGILLRLWDEMRLAAGSDSKMCGFIIKAAEGQKK